MTKGKVTNKSRLAYEILGLIGISAFCAVMLFLILSGAGAAIVDVYCFRNDVVLTEFDWLEVDRWIWGLSGALSAAGFSLLFLVLLGDRMA